MREVGEVMLYVAHAEATSLPLVHGIAVITHTRGCEYFQCW